MERQRGMITIGDILRPKHILFKLDEDSRERAVARVAALLQNDPRVSDWAQFFAGLEKGTSCMTKENGSTLCIAHVRTNAVSAMTMAVGRFIETAAPAVLPAPAQPSPDAPAQPVPPPPIGPKLHLVFVIGVPVALASDYLRIIGALARIFHTDEGEASLAGAATPEAFLENLGHLEIAL